MYNPTTLHRLTPQHLMTKSNVSLRPEILHVARGTFRNRRGASLVEVLLATSMIVLVSFGVQTLLNQSTKLGQTNKQIGQLQSEHDSLKALVLSIPSSRAGSVICQYPHPYMDYQEGTARCLQGMGKTGPIPAPTAADMKNWNAASEAVFEWASNERGNAGHAPPTLSSTFFSSTVLPALTAAKCLDCHDGSYGDDPVVLKRDFRQLSELEKAPALASRAMLGGGLGRKLLRSTMVLPSLSVDGKGITHNLSFFNSSTCKAPTQANRTFYAADAATAACPGNCNAGEYPDPERCNVSCNTFGKAASSTEPAPCTQYKRDVVCFVPQQKCNVTPPCPGPPDVPTQTVYAASSCQENQPSMDCGRGATTWRCLDPSKPLATQANIVVFSLLSSAAANDVQGKSRNINTEGALQ